MQMIMGDPFPDFSLKLHGVLSLETLASCRLWPTVLVPLDHSSFRSSKTVEILKIYCCFLSPSSVAMGLQRGVSDKYKVSLDKIEAWSYFVI
jgi:hypothetical protein